MHYAKDMLLQFCAECKVHLEIYVFFLVNKASANSPYDLLGDL